ncbi:MAG: hypothetical protein RL301_564, partial [Actinomycetota bacterium]
FGLYVRTLLTPSITAFIVCGFSTAQRANFTFEREMGQNEPATLTFLLPNGQKQAHWTHKHGHLRRK